jgi:anion-transporting  ArsA/GET3 family ATPase
VIARRSRLVVVIGKGGVGRSTIAAALARQATAAGERVLAVDALAAGGLRLALGHGSTVVTGQPVELDPAGPGRLTLLELSTEAALEEYVHLNLRLPLVPTAIGPIARIFDFVATAAPAVREILTIGKIGHEVRRGPWDLVVVDGPATGHVIELLSAPDALRELVGFGPLAEETGWLSELLADGDKTTAIAVTTPEELPVTETIELLDRLRKETDVALGGLIVNRLPPPVTAAGEAEAAALAASGDPLAPLATIAVDRHRRAVAERGRLRSIGARLIEIGDAPDDPTGAALAAISGAGW